MKKVCVITCYGSSDYVRASTLRKATKSLHGYKLISIKNHRKGFLRYPEVALKVLIARVRERPHMYLLTFRGYEMVLPVRILTIGRPFVFDEFINLEEWLIENQKIKDKTFVQRLVGVLYRSLMRLPNLLITDTVSHAKYSAQRNRLPAGKVIPVPVAADEDIFFPTHSAEKTRMSSPLMVFYYGGQMLPLHGISYVLEAAAELRAHNVEFVIIGGKKTTAKQVEEYKAKGAKITYLDRVPYPELAAYAQQADVCLGGPFGGTLQSRFVITGKTYQFMACARPTIVGVNEETDTGLFRDKINCILVEQASTSSIVGALLWCEANRTRLEKIGRAARSTYERDFSLKKVSHQLSEVFAKLQ